MGREGSEKTVPDVEALERQISDLQGQQDAAAEIIVAKDNEIEGLNKNKEKLQISLQRVKHRMRQLGAELWRGGALEHRGTDAEGEGSLCHKSD